VAVGEYDPRVAGSASSSARLVAAASSRLGALVADLRQAGASCGVGGAHEAAHVANARVRDAEAHAQSGTPSALVGAKLSVVRQAAVDAIAEAKCDATRHCCFRARFCSQIAMMQRARPIAPAHAVVWFICDVEASTCSRSFQVIGREVRRSLALEATSRFSSQVRAMFRSSFVKVPLRTHKLCRPGCRNSIRQHDGV
jgi:hypothetical protein